MSSDTQTFAARLGAVNLLECVVLAQTHAH